MLRYHNVFDLHVIEDNLIRDRAIVPNIVSFNFDLPPTLIRTSKMLRNHFSQFQILFAPTLPHTAYIKCYSNMSGGREWSRSKIFCNFCLQILLVPPLSGFKPNTLPPSTYIKKCPRGPGQWGPSW